MEINTIHLGDAYELIKQVPDKSVDLIVTDPPYEYQSMRGGGICERLKVNKEIEENGIDKGIDPKILDQMVRVMKKINIYLWCSKDQIYDYLTYFVKERNCNWEMLIWAKDNPTPFCGTHYLIDKEYCLYFWEQGAKVEIPFERGRTVFLTKVNINDKKLYSHPTIKPEQIVENLIKNSCGGGVSI